MVPTADAKDVLLALHHENSGQARHHEEQRQRIALCVVLGGAIVIAGVASAGARGPTGFLAGLFLAALGTFGFCASLHHHERSRLHVQRVHAVRRTLSERLPVDILALYADANAEHHERFAWLSARTARIHWLWQGLHGTVVAVGILLLGLSCLGGR